MGEIFKEIKGYEGLYQVSNLGRVKSLERQDSLGRIIKGRILKSGLNKKGYYNVRLCKNGKGCSYLVHKLVAITFLNHTPQGYKEVVDHINNDKTDNRVENLNLISSRENTSKDRTGGSSKYVGVCWDKQRNKWRSRIQIGDKEVHLGRFDDEKIASIYYQTALGDSKNKNEK